MSRPFSALSCLAKPKSQILMDSAFPLSSTYRMLLGFRSLCTTCKPSRATESRRSTTAGFFSLDLERTSAGSELFYIMSNLSNIVNIYYFTGILYSYFLIVAWYKNGLISCLNQFLLSIFVCCGVDTARSYVSSLSQPALSSCSALTGL